MLWRGFRYQILESIMGKHKTGEKCDSNKWQNWKIFTGSEEKTEKLGDASLHQ